jgi:hypothetical protein
MTLDDGLRRGPLREQPLKTRYAIKEVDYEKTNLIAILACLAFSPRRLRPGVQDLRRRGNPAALGGDKQGMIGLSKDGVKWDFISLEDEDETLEQAPLDGNAYGAGRLVAVGGNKIVVSGGREKLALSDNFPERMNGGLRAVAYGGGMFVAVGGTSAVRLVEKTD